MEVVEKIFMFKEGDEKVKIYSFATIIHHSELLESQSARLEAQEQIFKCAEEDHRKSEMQTPESKRSKCRFNYLFSDWSDLFIDY